MTTQTLTIGKKKFVLMSERDFLSLQKRAAENEVRPEVARDAMRDLRRYRKTRRGSNWNSVRRKLGL